MQNDAEFMAIWGIGRALWNKDWFAVSDALAAAEGACSGSPANLVGVLRGELQDANLALIARAYETISVAAAVKLSSGLSEAVLLERVAALGWELDSSANMLKPCVPEAPAEASVSKESLRRLTEHMVRLDA